MTQYTVNPHPKRVRFFTKGMSGKSVLDKHNRLWVKQKNMKVPCIRKSIMGKDFLYLIYAHEGHGVYYKVCP
jgi:hypothetical protein